MKKTVVTLFVGMIIGMMIGTTTGVFAALGDTLEVIVGDYVIKVDGKEQNLDVSPVAINDSTYVPLRAMANMLGKDVTYKADSRTIELNTPPSSTTGSEVSIVNTSKIETWIAEQLENKGEFSNKLSNIISELKSNGESDEEINKNPIVMHYRSMVADIDKNITGLEAQKTELEAQQ